VFRVIYLWRGERHVHSRQPDTKQEAEQIASDMRAARWQAWVEPTERAT
jgi:hypothetical protein